jgi:hypothetical protein
MTRRTNATVAGSALLLYIAVGVTQMAALGDTTAGEGAAAQLASMAQHSLGVRLDVVLGLLTCFFALILGVTFHAITREEDPDLAMLALTCRVAEGVIGGLFLPLALGLLAVATATDVDAPEAGAANALGSLVLTARSWVPVIAASFFAVGSTIFSWLLLRGRMIPTVLAWLGVVASVLLVVGLPLRLLGVLHGTVALLLWLPMAGFEIPLGLWLIIKGAAFRGDAVSAPSTAPAG